MGGIPNRLSSTFPAETTQRWTWAQHLEPSSLIPQTCMLGAGFHIEFTHSHFGKWFSPRLRLPGSTRAHCPGTTAQHRAVQETPGPRSGPQDSPAWPKTAAQPQGCTSTNLHGRPAKRLIRATQGADVGEASVHSLKAVLHLGLCLPERRWWIYEAFWKSVWILFISQTPIPKKLRFLINRSAWKTRRETLFPKSISYGNLPKVPETLLFQWPSVHGCWRSSPKGLKYYQPGLKHNKGRRCEAGHSNAAPSEWPQTANTRAKRQRGRQRSKAVTQLTLCSFQKPNFLLVHNHRTGFVLFFYLQERNILDDRQVSIKYVTVNCWWTRGGCLSKNKLWSAI